ncbi:MAG: protein kinase, partial [Bdellovibrionales bacterium]|nr:protein kinase [Bdellovibrionales bacterium]
GPILSVISRLCYSSAFARRETGMSASGKRPLIESFDFEPGRILARKYEVVQKLGGGWEGEVYIVRERSTGIERAGKFFFPHRNPNDRVSRLYAQKLHKLRGCEVLIQYHTEESITFQKVPITFLISEYVEGEILKEFLSRQPGKRLSVFEGLHLLHALAQGLEPVHNAREYHGDLHAENVIIKRRGLGFELKLIDMFHWNSQKVENIRDDVCDCVRIFYDSIGGQKMYAKHPPVVKQVCCGLKRGLILKKYRTAGQLRRYLETLEWDSPRT